MTSLNWQGVAVLIGIVMLALVEAAVYDVVMLCRHGTPGTISSGMEALGRHSPLSAVMIGGGLMALVVGLCVHFWGK